MKTLAVLVNTGNYGIKYFLKMYEGLNPADYHWVVLPDYLQVNQDQYDVVIYNTFPDESHPKKFNKELTDKCDAKFKAFKGKRILFDTFDKGTQDGFARFNDFSLPRIKVNPSYEAIKKMNVFMTIPFIVYSVYLIPQRHRPYKLVCAMRTRRMPYVRQHVFEKVKQFNPVVGDIPIVQHARRLCRTWINIVPNGTGDSCLSHGDTLAAGAMLIAEESFKNIKILPFADLREGRHYVSFTLDNVADKLNILLNDPASVERIRRNGMKAFRVGYDYKRSAEQLSTFINTL